jgi:hypothetical protein
MCVCKPPPTTMRAQTDSQGQRAAPRFTAPTKKSGSEKNQPISKR